MARYSRTAWGARSPRNRTLMPSVGVEGIAFHWPAMGGRRVTSVSEAKSSLRGWQNFHMDNRGYDDIAYQEAIDQAGNVYVLRGFRVRSGANGNTDLNRRYGAVLLILGEGERPTGAMMKAAHRRIRAWRRRHPTARKIVGHGQIRPGGSTCPGPIVQGLINAGEFEPPPGSRGQAVDAALTRLKRAERRARNDGRTVRARRLRRAIEWVEKIQPR